jgi:WD40 repeat protein
MILGFEERSIPNSPKANSSSSSSSASSATSSASSSPIRLASGVSAWDPHSTSLCAVAFDNTFQIVDTKEMEIVQQLPSEHQHHGIIRDIDYNPNKSHTLITASDDRTVKFWDLRKLQTPLVTLMGHSHWTWTAKYNPFHDQLILRFVHILIIYYFIIFDLLLIVLSM